MRNAAIDPHGEFLATTGCDGKLKITQITKNDHSLIQTHDITFPVKLSSNQWMGLAWSPSGDYLFFRRQRDNQICYVSRADSFADIKPLDGVSHKPAGNISFVHALSEKCIVTAGLDRFVKVWRLPEGPTVPEKI